MVFGKSGLEPDISKGNSPNEKPFVRMENDISDILETYI